MRRDTGGGGAAGPCGMGRGLRAGAASVEVWLATERGGVGAGTAMATSSFVGAASVSGPGRRVSTGVGSGDRGGSTFAVGGGRGATYPLRPGGRRGPLGDIVPERLSIVPARETPDFVGDCGKDPDDESRERLSVMEDARVGTGTRLPLPGDMPGLRGDERSGVSATRASGSRFALSSSAAALAWRSRASSCSRIAMTRDGPVGEWVGGRGDAMAANERELLRASSRREASLSSE
jgi:hypothetical protein